MIDDKVDMLSALEKERELARAARRERAMLRRRAEVVSVRLPVAVHATLIAVTRREGVSKNRAIVNAIKKYLGLGEEPQGAKL